MDDRKTILVIDDYETSAAGWGLYLHNAKYSVETAYSPEEGLQLFAIRPIDLVLLDYAMQAKLMMTGNPNLTTLFPHHHVTSTRPPLTTVPDAQAVHGLHVR